MNVFPWDLNQYFVKEQIIELASFIVKIRGEVIDRHDTELGDTSLSLGMRAYECCKTRIKRMAESKKWLWLSILTPNGRFTFSINSVPVRFVRNSVEELPDQKLILSEEAEFQMKLFEDKIYSNLRWFIVLDTAYNNPGDRVFFAAYDENKYIQCKWQVPLEENVSFLSTVDEKLPEAVEIPEAEVQIKTKITLLKNEK